MALARRYGVVGQEAKLSAQLTALVANPLPKLFDLAGAGYGHDAR